MVLGFSGGSLVWLCVWLMLLVGWVGCLAWEWVGGVGGDGWVRGGWVFGMKVCDWIIVAEISYEDGVSSGSETRLVRGNSVVRGI